MKTDAKWVGSSEFYPKRFALKKDCHGLNPGERLLRIEFRFEVAYVIRNHNGEVYMGNAKWMPTFDFYLINVGRVIGPQDMSAADNTKFAESWRYCCLHRRLGNSLTA